MEPEHRAEVEHSLMGEYHDALSEGGVTAYSMYDAWEDYRHGVTYALVGAIAVAGTPGLEHDAAAWCVPRVLMTSTLCDSVLTFLHQGGRPHEALPHGRGGSRPGVRRAVQSRLIMFT